MLFSKIRKIKEIPFKSVLGDLEQKLVFVTQPLRAIFKVSFEVIFPRKTHESFLKS